MGLRNDGLLQAIKDDPFSNELRLIYADWLEERGDPRGEYVRLQVDGNLCPERQAQLLNEHYEEWLADDLGCSPDLIRQLNVRAEFHRGLAWTPLTRRYPGKPRDQEKWLRKLIKAGKYTYVNPDITLQNFPWQSRGGGCVNQLFFLRFMRQEDFMTIDEGITRFDQVGLKAATLLELCVFGAHYWKGKPRCVVALGSSRKFTYNRGRYRDVPYLFDWRDGRELDLREEWDDDCCFAAVRE